MRRFVVIVLVLSCLLAGCGSGSGGCAGCPIPENGIVVLNPRAETEKEFQISVEEYDRRVEAMAATVGGVGTVSLTLGLYSERVSDLCAKFVAVDEGDTEKFAAYEEYSAKFAELVKLPGIAVGQLRGDRLEIDVYDLVFGGSYAYAFLISDAGVVTPVYPNWAGYNFAMVNWAGQTGYRAQSVVSLGHYTFYAVNMPSSEELDVSNGSVKAFELDLVAHGDPVNESLGTDADGHAWWFVEP